jgi:hypothetical protein
MPNNLPVDPCPAGIYDDRKELWYCCTGIVNHHETGDDLKQMALGIRQQLRLEARVNELTELFYSVKAERDKLKAAIKKHWSQKADDRCWMDDSDLYVAAGLPDGSINVGNKAAMLENCKRFIEARCQSGRWRSYAELESLLREVAEIAAVLFLETEFLPVSREGYLDAKRRWLAIRAAVLPKEARRAD